MTQTQAKSKQGSAAPAEEIGDGEPDGTASERTRDSGPARRRRRRERASERTKRVSEERLAQAREMAAELRHKRDCPEEGALPGDDDVRVEFSPARRPASDEKPAKDLIVVRCLECGETEVDDDTSEE